MNRVSIVTDNDPEQWLQQFGDALYSYAVARVSDAGAAEDLVQETFLAVVKNPTSFDGRSSRLTWLIAILKRKVIDYYRRSQTQPGGTPLLSLDELPEDSISLFDRRGGFKRRLGKWPADPAATLMAEEFWSVFHQCRRALPNNLQVAFNLREMDDLETDGICAELGITASALGVRLHRARLLLRHCLERKWFRNES